jgi:hypothetical protein
MYAHKVDGRSTEVSRIDPMETWLGIINETQEEATEEYASSKGHRRGMTRATSQATTGVV